MDIGLLILFVFAIIVGYVLLRVIGKIIWWFIIGLIIIGLLFGWQYASNILNGSVATVSNIANNLKIEDKIHMNLDGSVEITIDDQHKFSTKDIRIISEVNEDNPIVIETKDGQQYTFVKDENIHKLLVELHKNGILK